MSSVVPSDLPAPPEGSKPEGGSDPELTVIIVSYNTRALTLKCLQTLYENTHQTRFHTVLVDNASTDGSAAAVAAAFPQVEVIARSDNLGFAGANNLVGAQATTEWLLLLNPDTEVYDGAIDTLLAFSRAHPEAGLTGGRTFFPDGRLNPLSCQGRITLWSSISRALGLTTAFPRSGLFNPEAYGAWPRDSVREVDIIVGCFLMIPTALWQRLGGFDRRYFMYGEDSDLSLRARALGYRPMLCPDARIMHLVGASFDVEARKTVMVATSRVTQIRTYFPRWQVPLGLASMWLWAGLRTAASQGLGLLPGARHKARAANWRHIWAARRTWLAGY
jgi:GT2 family glycosyltransferase